MKGSTKYSTFWAGRYVFVRECARCASVVKELQDKHERLERNFRQQCKEFQQVTERMNKLISALEMQLQEQQRQSCENWNQAEQNVQLLEQKMLQVAKTQKEYQSATEQCIKTVAAKSNAETEAVVKRVEEIDAQQLGTAAVAKTLDTRLIAMENLQLQKRSDENRAELQKVRDLMKGLDNRTKPLSVRRTFNYVKARSMQSINRDYVASMVENMYEKGVSDWTGKPRLIVSLTSYPKRMYDIHLCLYSLLTQDLKPDKVILWLAEEQFPHRSKDVPKKVRDLKKFGLEIKWCSDLKSYKKLIPALQQYPDACIVTADDDIYYPENWLRGLWETQQHTGAGVVAHRCHEAAYEGDAFLPYAKWSKCIEREDLSYANFMTGAGGILYAPGCFHPDIMNVAKFQELCPHGDDIWFWTMALLNGTKIAIPPQPYRNLVYTNPEREVNANDDGTLFAVNGAGGNDVQLANVLAAYPELGALLQAES